MFGMVQDLGIYLVYYENFYVQVMGGVCYLVQMLVMFDGNIIYSLVVYNVGLGNVQCYGGVLFFVEIQYYVQVILECYNFYFVCVGGVDVFGMIDLVLFVNLIMSFIFFGVGVYGDYFMVLV